ncbi:MAG: hypothetical protein ABIM31_00465 [candidate division WOR-3 bacterium]
MAWSNDVEIVRYADGKYPSKNDIAWPVLNNMVAGIGYYEDNNLYINLYQSVNQGRSWQLKSTIPYLTLKIQLDYWDAYFLLGCLLLYDVTYRR